jgi:hypothetical protein
LLRDDCSMRSNFRASGSSFTADIDNDRAPIGVGGADGAATMGGR